MLPTTHTHTRKQRHTHTHTRLHAHTHTCTHSVSGFAWQWGACVLQYILWHPAGYQCLLVKAAMHVPSNPPISNFIKLQREGISAEGDHHTTITAEKFTTNSQGTRRSVQRLYWMGLEKIHHICFFSETITLNRMGLILCFTCMDLVGSLCITRFYLSSGWVMFSSTSLSETHEESSLWTS